MRNGKSFVAELVKYLNQHQLLKNGKKPDKIRIIADVYRKHGKTFEYVEKECCANSDVDESYSNRRS